MNAPSQNLAPQIQFIALDRLLPSPTNPRKRFDEAKLKELAESIKAQGVLQPLLVRAMNDEYLNHEVIAGERRYRAAKLAGLAELPCFVRDLTDAQVLHAQVIENLQRDDLHPLEEAEGYQRLVELGSKVEDLGTEIGKSRAYIYARLKLLDLCEPARKAFFDGKLDASTALLIARIPVHKVQIEALESMTDYDGDPIPYRRARDILQRDFMLNLNETPFDAKDAALLPKAGSCTDCPKRTGNQKDLFNDVKNPDVCTDTVCFGMKKAAHVLQLQKQAVERGDTVIKGKEAKKLLPQSYGGNEYRLKNSGLAPLDSHIPNDAKGLTWEQALKHKKLTEPDKTGSIAVHKTLIEDPHHPGEIIQAVSIEEATKALRQAGFEISLRGSSASPGQSKQMAEHEAKQKMENSYRERLFDTLHQQLSANLSIPNAPIKAGLWLLLAEECWDLVWEPKHKASIARQFIEQEGMNQEQLIDAFEKNIEALPPQEHFVLMTACMMIGNARNMERIAEIEGIDAAAIKQEIEEEAKQAAAAAKAKKPEAKKAPNV